MSTLLLRVRSAATRQAQHHHHHYQHHRHPQQRTAASPILLNAVVVRRFSSSTNEHHQETNESTINKQQPFVRTRIDPGEWDPERKDPLYRPKFQSTAKILHADDFARRPKVGYTGEFENYHDAMITLSHLGQKQQKEIYDRYISLMLGVESHHAGRTSHEYIYRVLAQQFKMTIERIASVVLLQHNEERYKCEGKVELVDDAVVAQIDTKFNNMIAEAYQTTGERPPQEFNEDPVGSGGEPPHPNTKKYTDAPDLLDLERMTSEWTVREGRRARLIIDGHVYKEDQDDDAVPLPLSKTARKLLSHRARLAQALANDPIVEDQRQKGLAVEPEYRTVGAKGKGQRRPRWRYVAQIVDTRTRRKINNKNYRGGMVNDAPENTLVECDGVLRPGTLADCKTVAWMPKRNALEHLIAPVRKGWLDRTLRNQPLAWGKAPQSLVEAHAAKFAAAAEGKDGDAATVEEDNADNKEEEGGDTNEASEESTATEDDGASSDKEPPTKEEETKEDDEKSKK